MSEHSVSANSSALYANAFPLGRYCADTNAAFLRCKEVNAHPAACQNEAIATVNCTKDYFQTVAKSPCQKLSEEYAQCLTRKNNTFDYCRKAKDAFESCYETHLSR